MRCISSILMSAWLGIIVISLGLCAPAKALTCSYDSTVNFTINPGGDWYPIVTIHNDNTARVRDPRTRSDIKVGGVVVPPEGGSGVATANVPAPRNSAQANTGFTVNPYGMGTPITASIRTYGSATAIVPREAYASSIGDYNVWSRTTLPNGWTSVGPLINVSTAGGTSASMEGTLDYEVRDLITNAVGLGRLLALYYHLYGGNGNSTMIWDTDTGVLKFDMSPNGNADFKIDLSSPNTKQQGNLELTIRNGLITKSIASGIFNGVLPKEGSSGTFQTTLNAIECEFNLGDYSGHDLEVTLRLNSYNKGNGVLGGGIPEVYPLILDE